MRAGRAGQGRVDLMARLIRLAVSMSLGLLLASPAAASAVEWRGLLTGWASGGFREQVRPQFGFRYLPSLSLAKNWTSGLSLDLELSLNAYGTAFFFSGEDIRTEARAKPYRGWIRLAGPRMEARIGLQKINFGSASLLRPLMWFDTLDPRDPLQLTDGVYGILLRSFFQNNANIWLWGLYGNDNPRGWDAIPSHGRSPEFGGRIQLPVPRGEAAVTYHQRRIDLDAAELFPFPVMDPLVPERRIALDGKWDIGIGVWIEGTLTHQDSDLLPLPWRRALNLGMDYTFGLGNGLNMMGEMFWMQSSEKAFSSGEGLRMTALSLNYPLSLLDNLSAIVYYDWENRELYRFLNWQRTYDRWRLHAIVFWNPDDFRIYRSGSGEDLFTGAGFQIMAVYNY